MLATTSIEGPLACLASAALWAFALTWFRPVIARHGAVPVNFLKCVLALFAYLAIWLARNGITAPTGLDSMHAYEWSTLFISGLFGMVVADTFGFLAVVRIGAPLSLLVHLLSPFVSGLLAWVQLGERMPGYKWWGVVLTVCGIAIATVRRSGSAVHDRRDLRLGLLFAFLAMTTNSLALVWTKPAMAQMEVLPVASLRLLVCVVVLGAFECIRGRRSRLFAPLHDREQRRSLVLATLFGTVGAFYFYNLGIQRSNAAVTAALTGTSPLFAIPVAWMLEGLRPRALAVAGALLAFAGATWIALGERLF